MSSSSLSSGQNDQHNVISPEEFLGLIDSVLNEAEAIRDYSLRSGLNEIKAVDEMSTDEDDDDLHSFERDLESLSDRGNEMIIEMPDESSEEFLSSHEESEGELPDEEMWYESNVEISTPFDNLSSEIDAIVDAHDSSHVSSKIRTAVETDKIEVDMLDEKGQTALTRVLRRFCQKKYAELPVWLPSQLLTMGADVNACRNKAQCPGPFSFAVRLLMKAILERGRHYERELYLVRLLIRYSPDVNKKGWYVDPPLVNLVGVLIAFCFDQARTVKKRLLKGLILDIVGLGADLNPHQRGGAPFLSRAIHHAARVCEVPDRSYDDEDSRSEVVDADGLKWVLNVLIDSGLEPKAENPKDGYTPIMTATKALMVDGFEWIALTIIKILLQYGADLSLENKAGYPPSAILASCLTKIELIGYHKMSFYKIVNFFVTNTDFFARSLATLKPPSILLFEWCISGMVPLDCEHLILKCTDVLCTAFNTSKSGKGSPSLFDYIFSFSKADRCSIRRVLYEILSRGIYEPEKALKIFDFCLTECLKAKGSSYNYPEAIEIMYMLVKYGFSLNDIGNSRSIKEYMKCYREAQFTELTHLSYVADELVNLGLCPDAEALEDITIQDIIGDLRLGPNITVRHQGYTKCWARFLEKLEEESVRNLVRSALNDRKTCDNLPRNFLGASSWDIFAASRWGIDFIPQLLQAELEADLSSAGNKEERIECMRKFRLYEEQDEVSGNSGLMRLIDTSRDDAKSLVSSWLKEHPSSNIDLRNSKGETALILAARRNKVEQIQELLFRRASPDLTCQRGLTALDHACEAGATDVVYGLLSEDLLKVGMRVWKAIDWVLSHPLRKREELVVKLIRIGFKLLDPIVNGKTLLTAILSSSRMDEANFFFPLEYFSHTSSFERELNKRIDDCSVEWSAWLAKISKLLDSESRTWREDLQKASVLKEDSIQLIKNNDAGRKKGI